MTNKPSYNQPYVDTDWGCTHVNVKVDHHVKNIAVCHVKVSDIMKIAQSLSKSILDTAWVMNIDANARRAYQRTVQDTAELLIEIFNSPHEDESLSDDFGEIMVSMGSSRALSMIFNHISLPVSELWKPKRKQNEGFDFHTVCEKELIHFGEAKYSAKINP